MKAVLHIYVRQNIFTERDALDIDPMLCWPRVDATMSRHEFSGKCQ